MYGRRPTTKLTAITITHNEKKLQEFLWLHYENGKAVLSQGQLNGLLEKLKVPRGSSFSIG